MNQTIDYLKRLIDIQAKLIANQQGQIDALKGVQADKTDPEYLSGYGYQYAVGQKLSGLDEAF
jgi:hypothetical protein